MDKLDEKILKLLDKNARMECSDIAAVVGIGEDEAASRIKEMEKSGVICGYKAL